MDKIKLWTNKCKTPFLIICLILFLFMFYLLNVETGLFADDYSYSVSFANGERITAINQIPNSLFSHYFSINGRLVTHFLAQFFLFLGDSVFNIINTVAFLLLIFLMYYHSIGSILKIKKLWLVIIPSLFFIVSPSIGQSYLWITGAANYLYGIIIILLFLIPYRRQLTVSKKVNYFLEIVYTLVMLIFGLIAGATGENISVAGIVGVVCFIIAYKLKHIKFRIWNFSGLLGMICGFIFILFAPGTQNRLEGAGGVGGIFSILKRIIFISANTVEYLWPIIFIGILLIACLKGKYNIKELFISNYSTIIFFITTVISIYSMVLSPEFPSRTWSGPVILSIITLGNFYCCNKFIVNKKINAIKIISTALLIILSFSSIFNGYFVLKNSNTYFKERVKTITECQDENIYVPTITSNSKYACYENGGDLSSDPTMWPNTSIARYYSKGKIIFNGEVLR